MSIRKFGCLFVLSAILAACCLEAFDIASDGQGSMAGAVPTASEINIACLRAKANMKTKCESICAGHATSTDPKVKPFVNGNMVIYSECKTVPDSTHLVVHASYGGKCECCD